MGKLTPTAADNVLRLSEAVLSAADAATPWHAFSGRFNLEIAGTFTGAAVVERSFDGGETAIALSSLGAPVQFAGPASEVLEAPEEGVLYRVRCVSLSSGQIRARLSQ